MPRLTKYDRFKIALFLIAAVGLAIVVEIINGVKK